MITHTMITNSYYIILQSFIIKDTCVVNIITWFEQQEKVYVKYQA